MPGSRGTYRRYPLRIVVLVNATTIVSILLGTAGIMVGLQGWPRLAFGLATLYFAFSVLHTYLIMPITVCPACVYRLGCRGGVPPAAPGEKPHRAALPEGPLGPDTPRCASGLNVISALRSRPADPRSFAGRGGTILCQDTLALAVSLAPAVLMVTALLLAFGWVLLALLAASVALLVFRVFGLFPRIVCAHCAARPDCPNAGGIGAV